MFCGDAAIRHGTRRTRRRRVVALHAQWLAIDAGECMTVRFRALPAADDVRYVTIQTARLALQTRNANHANRHIGARAART